ncbi:MAG: hypothetical protein GY835_23930 [bacterium]|nr:hypothetical protein [bacterium]
MLGRRVIAPRHVVLVQELDEGGWWADPAVDLDRSDPAKYIESYYDLKHLTAKGGEQWSTFKVRSLTRRQKDAIEGLSVRQTATWVVRSGLLGHSEFNLMNADGEVLPVAQPERKQNGEFGEMVTEKWLDDVNLPSIVLLGLCRTILNLSEAQLPLSGRSEPQSGPPDPDE